MTHTNSKVNFEKELIKIIKNAGNLLVRNLAKPEALAIDERKLNGDYSIAMDKNVEKFIVESIKSCGIEGLIIAEESGNMQIGGKSEFTFYVDPIDGTLNYSRGIPIFCVSIGVADGEGMCLGLVYDPVRNELFSAKRGGGAFINGNKIKRKSDVNKISILGVDQPQYLDSFIEEAIKDDKVGVQMIWSIALNLCYLACGRYSLSLSPYCKPWDIAASAFIAEESGATVTNFRGQKWNVIYPNIIGCTDPSLYKRFFNLLQKSLSSSNTNVGKL